jgi:hypothetical protein
MKNIFVMVFTLVSATIALASADSDRAAQAAIEKCNSRLSRPEQKLHCKYIVAQNKRDQSIQVHDAIVAEYTHQRFYEEAVRYRRKARLLHDNSMSRDRMLTAAEIAISDEGYAQANADAEHNIFAVYENLEDAQEVLESLQN